MFESKTDFSNPRTKFENPGDADAIVNISIVLVSSQALGADHSAIDVTIDLLRLIAVFSRFRHLQLELADGRREFGVLLELALLLGSLLLFTNRSLAGRGDLAGGRKARLRETLFLRQIFVFDESLVVVLAQPLAEEVLHQTDVSGEVVHANGVVSWWWLEDEACCRDRSLVLCLIAAVQAVLE